MARKNNVKLTPLVLLLQGQSLGHGRFGDRYARRLESGVRRDDRGDHHANRNKPSVRKSRRTLDFEQGGKTNDGEK